MLISPKDLCVTFFFPQRSGTPHPLFNQPPISLLLHFHFSSGSLIQLVNIFICPFTIPPQPSTRRCTIIRPLDESFLPPPPSFASCPILPRIMGLLKNIFSQCPPYSSLFRGVPFLLWFSSPINFCSFESALLSANFLQPPSSLSFSLFVLCVLPRLFHI